MKAQEVYRFCLNCSELYHMFKTKHSNEDEQILLFFYFWEFFLPVFLRFNGKQCNWIMFRFLRYFVLLSILFHLPLFVHDFRCTILQKKKKKWRKESFKLNTSALTVKSIEPDSRNIKNDVSISDLCHGLVGEAVYFSLACSSKR